MIDDIIGAGKAVTQVANKTVLSALTLGKAYGRRSISRLAKESIFQYPLIVSGGIDTDEIVAIARGFEKEYASFTVSAISVNHDIDRTKYSSTAQFLKSIHNTSNVPMPIYNNGSILLESVETIPEGESNVYVDPVMMRSLWTIELSQFDTDIINDEYLPFNRTMKKLKNRLDIATEATPPPFYSHDEQNIKAAAYGQSDDVQDEASRAVQWSQKVRLQQYEQDLRDEGAAKLEKLKFGRTAAGITGSNINSRNSSNTNMSKFYNDHPLLQSAKDRANNFNRHNQSPVEGIGRERLFDSVVDDRGRLSTLEPTLVNVVLTHYTKQAVWNDNVTIGVKTMIRLVPPQQMVANMIDACHDRLIFKFIKWTRGELGIADVLFGKSHYKKLGIQKAKGQWLSALRVRAKIDNVGKIAGSRLLPSTSIVITENEAKQVLEETGVDLHDVRNIQRIFKRYFLLGFAIYDTDARIMHAIFDGDSEYTTVSMRHLISLVKTATDTLNNSKRF